MIVMTSGDASSRRERNKVRTRQAIKSAVLDLALERDIGTVTAEEIAEHAGISRRTFFNYYAGLDAVLVEATLEPMHAVAERFLQRPADEDPLAAMVAALEGPAPVELARWSVALCRESTQGTEVYARMWQLHTAWLRGVLQDRLGAASVDPLYVAGLAGAVMSVFSAAQATWLTRTGGRLDEASLEDLSHDVRSALQHARDGWRAPPRSARTTADRR
jgi:AcrR family transcriptional regulator